MEDSPVIVLSPPSSKIPGQQGKRKKPSFRGKSPKKQVISEEIKEEIKESKQEMVDMKKKYKEKIKKLKSEVKTLEKSLMEEKLQHEKLKGFMEGIGKKI